MEEQVDNDGFFGPALPPGFKKQQSSPERSLVVFFDDIRSINYTVHFEGCNPNRPPHRPPVLGPALPPGFRRAMYEQNDDDEDADVVGPALPPGYQPDSSSSEDEDMIGPMPSKGPTEDSVATDFERRAQRMKEKLTGEVHSP